MPDRVYLFDTTLRDGAQTLGVDFSVTDKAAIAQALDKLGIDYVEGGWPGANPTDNAFFAEPPPLKQAKFTAFGMTRRPGRSAANDPGLAAIMNARTPVVTLVGKSWDFHVDVALNISREENLAMISDSLAHCVALGREAIYDAEHFFDGYKANPTYALACLRVAYAAGARWLVLCDTNGGSLPQEVAQIVREVAQHFPGEKLGIHAHNDTENAVANSLVAVQAGARLIQGTINGLGERCGNANLISILPTLVLKMGFDTGVSKQGLSQLTRVSHFLDERLNRAPNRYAPYVGASAFAHKGGLHVSAVEKNSRTYEHIPPETVGNQRRILVSDQAGRSNLIARCRELNIVVPENPAKLDQLVELVKLREFDGYSYDSADASFELLARRLFDDVPEFFTVTSFRVLDEQRWNALGKLVTCSEATIRVTVEGKAEMTVADGNGPVNALDLALRKALIPIYPSLEEIHLTDYKVRILTPQEGTKAITRVMIESQRANGKRWTTVGVSPNIIVASFNALHDVISYALLRFSRS